MSTPKVIFANRVYWPEESATAQLLSDLAPALAARGFSVHVITGGDGPAQHEGVTVHRTGGDNSVTEFRRRTLSYLRFLRAARDRLAALATAGDVVVIKTDPPMLSAALTHVARQRGAAVVQWIQDIYPEIAWCHAGPWTKPLLKPLQASRDRAWRASACCVPVGDDMAELVHTRGVPRDRLRVLPNWAPRELDEIPSADAIAARRAAWGWTDKFVIAYSGNLGRVHEFRTLLDTAVRLRSRADIVIAFIGHGARWSDVAKAVSTQALSNVQLIPPQPRTELAVSLAAADIHAVTLLQGFESLVHPSKIAGVLAVGRPVAFVGPTKSSLARFLENAPCGKAIAPGSSEELAALIHEWQREPATRIRLGANARQAYVEHLRLSNLVPRWEALLWAVQQGTALPR